MIFKEFDINYLPEMISLFINSFNCSPWNDNWTKDIVEKRLLQLINCDGFDGMLAFEVNKLIGLILGVEEYSFTGREFVIKEFCVDNSLKGQGIGTKMLKGFETRLKSKGFSKITLMTLRSNYTMGFYEKQGYDEIENLLMMGKNI